MRTFVLNWPDRLHGFQLLTKKKKGMKTIFELLCYAVMTVVVLCSVLFILVLPELIMRGMEWLAIYIGEPTTWFLLIGAIVLFVKLCNYISTK